MHIFQTCKNALFVFQGTFWDCKVLIGWCCCKTFNWLKSRFMFQNFKCILRSFLCILSDWLQSSVLYLKLQHFTVIKLKLCVWKFQVYFMAIQCMPILPEWLQSEASCSRWNWGVICQRWEGQKIWKNVSDRGGATFFLFPSPSSGK